MKKKIFVITHECKNKQNIIFSNLKQLDPKHKKYVFEVLVAFFIILDDTFKYKLNQFFV